MSNDAAEWVLGKYGGGSLPAKPAKKMRGDATAGPPLDVSEAVDFLNEGGKSAKALVEDIKTVAGNTRLALGAGLNKRALLLLVQDLCPKLRNGDQISLSAIEGVITALANLDAHLVRK